jgi:catechol 2,3-dioxygenase-like lactoylglutathione lyase family enzyme
VSIKNAIASVAVRDLDASVSWYTSLLGEPIGKPTSDMAEWTFPGGGCLQVYVLPERAGRGSFTVSVTSIDEQADELRAIGIDQPAGPSNESVRTLMVKDPDGNSIAFAESLDPSRAH